MKILFVLENTMADLHGGTEVSSFHLASLLRKKGCEVTEWTPFCKRKPQFWYTSLAGQAYAFVKLIIYLLGNRPGAIHIQGKYLIPAAVAAGKLLKIPTIATIRDYIVICPIGLCLFQAPTKHGFIWYIKKEIPKFLKIYHPKDNHIIKIFKIIFLIRAWYVTKWLQFWLKKTNKVISVSKHVQQVLDMHGIESQTIYNAFDTGLYKDCPLLAEGSPLEKDKKTILFVGKPSYGKGYDLFQALSRNKLFKNYEFKTVGGKNKLPYLKTLDEIRKALVVVVPSRWPEPFGRAALESIMMGIPVLTTDVGGLPEIVQDKSCGYTCKPNIEQLTIYLRKIIENNVKLRKMIGKQTRTLTDKFREKPLALHLNLYNEII